MTPTSARKKGAGHVDTFAGHAVFCQAALAEINKNCPAPVRITARIRQKAQHDLGHDLGRGWPSSLSCERHGASIMRSNVWGCP